ncbi:FLYWCH zinc finger domain-containing protein [Phthorimaea operculella]|nr:FLYWCH zinc finger domain-containing protein [Phthorimaea operculella]
MGHFRSVRRNQTSLWSIQRPSLSFLDTNERYPVIYNTANGETAQFITTWRGFPMLVVGSYRYGLKTKYKEQQKKRWICVSWSRGCRAAVTTQDTTILAFKNQHNHYPCTPRRKSRVRSPLNTNIYCTAVFTTSSRGNPMIQIGSYNFALHSDCKRSAGPKKRWVCSMTASRRCRASVTTIDDVIVHCRNEHNH